MINRECAVVRAGDRLGIYFEELPWAVGYKFDNQQPATLQYKVEDIDNATQIFDSVTFDRLAFPYDFAVIAYLDKGKKSLLTCNMNLNLVNIIDIHVSILQIMHDIDTNGWSRKVWTENAN